MLHCVPTSGNVSLYYYIIIYPTNEKPWNKVWIRTRVAFSPHSQKQILLFGFWMSAIFSEVRWYPNVFQFYLPEDKEAWEHFHMSISHLNLFFWKMSLHFHCPIFQGSFFTVSVSEALFKSWILVPMTCIVCTIFSLILLTASSLC